MQEGCSMPSKKKIRKPRFPTFAQFRVRFLRILEGFYAADHLIGGILKQEIYRRQCADLLWFATKDSPARFALENQTERRSMIFTSALQDALRFEKAVKFIYSEMDSKPHFVESLGWLRSDLLLKLQAVERSFPPPKSHGRDRDWSMVLYAKMQLESLLQQTIPDATMADLLSAADAASGRVNAKKQDVMADDVRMGIKRLNQRTFERLLPFYQQVLSTHYPLGSDLSTAHKTPSK
jgi:hypothetical protein